MDQDTIIITIRDNDPLCVSVKRLTEDSRLFRYWICELNFTELEMDDFRPETVFIFLALLEDKTVQDIEDDHFRELHKMAVVFEVDWLTESCRKWLEKKMDKVISDGVAYEQKHFLLEESLYILNKWEISTFVDLFISKLATSDNSVFISDYMRDFHNLESNQIHVMLKLGGSNTKVFLQILLENITGKQSLDTNTKYLLNNMNLYFCLEQNDQLYHQMFETLSEMSELTHADFRFIMKLQSISLASALANSRETKTSSTTIWDKKVYRDLREGCNNLEDILNRVEDTSINNMFVVVTLLFKVTYNNPPTTEEIEMFIERLDNVCSHKSLVKVFSQFIDSYISLLTLSHREERVQFIALLEKIKNNSKLTSCHDYIIVNIDETKKKQAATNGILFPAEFKHPATPSECGMSGKCGLVIKISYDKDSNWKVELCKDKVDYEATKLHYHDVVSAEDMHYLEILSYTTQDGKKGRVYVYGYVWYRSVWNNDVYPWLPRSTNWGYEHICIAYNISKYLVAKQD